MKTPQFARGPLGDALLAVEIRCVHAMDPAYGTRRILQALRDRGIRVSRKRVIRLMRARPDLSRPIDPRKPIAHVEYAPRRVRRRAIPPGINRVWAGDTTQIATLEGWLYLTVWIDLRSRYLVGWAMSDRIDTALALAALRYAIATRQPARGLVVHSDRGAQFSSSEFRAELELHGFVQSMSRAGNCHDNAAVESFFSRFKRETRIRTLKREPRAVVYARAMDYLASYYNERRKHSSLGGLTPTEFERLSTTEQDRILTETRKRADRQRRARLARIKRRTQRK